jgi:hypothetical protein
LIRPSTRLARRCTADLRAIRSATTRIEELTSILDRQIDADARPEQQMRHLRQATGQITRSAIGESRRRWRQRSRTPMPTEPKPNGRNESWRVRARGC